MVQILLGAPSQCPGAFTPKDPKKSAPVEGLKFCHLPLEVALLTRKSGDTALLCFQKNNVIL